MGSLTFWGGARPSVVSGLAAIADLGNTLGQYNSIPADTYDTVQLALDWRMVGEDMRVVLRRTVPDIERRAARLAGRAR